MKQDGSNVNNTNNTSKNPPKVEGNNGSSGKPPSHGLLWRMIAAPFNWAWSAVSWSFSTVISSLAWLIRGILYVIGL